MRKKLRLWILCAALGAGLVRVESAAAQIFTPTYQAPRASSDVGIYLSSTPGDLAVEGIWRRSAAPYGLGLRAGLTEIADEMALLVGAELRSSLAAGTAPLDLALTGGIQGVFGGREGIGVQAGLSLGHTFVPGTFTVTPYLHPRVAIVNGLGGPDEFDLELLADLGVDIGFSQNLVLRFGIDFQEGGGIGVGLAWR